MALSDVFSAFSRPGTRRALALSASILALPAVAMADGPKADPDILGIKLGMTPAQVVEALKAAHPEFAPQQTEVVINNLPQTRYVADVHVEAPNGSFSVWTIAHFAPPPNDNTVYYVEQQTALPPEQGILETKLVEALTGKYGQPYNEVNARNGAPLRSMYWVWMTDGAAPPRTTSFPCAGAADGIAQGAGFQKGTPINLTRPVAFERLVKAGCARAAMARLTRLFSNTAITRTYYTALIDYAGLFAASGKTAAYIDRLAHEASQQQQQNAGRNAPKL